MKVQGIEVSFVFVAMLFLTHVVDMERIMFLGLPGKQVRCWQKCTVLPKKTIFMYTMR